MKSLWTACILQLIGSLLSAATIDFSKTTFDFPDEWIDVVIPVSPKESLTLEKAIEGVRENCPEVRRIILVSKTPPSDAAEWFDESLFPFTKFDIAVCLKQGDIEKAIEFLNAPKSRVGWYYQQLLKFYAPFVIPDISSNVLLVDSDTIFLNPVTFLTEEGAGLLNVGEENHEEYFNHARRLLPGFKKLFPEYSGITHHMLFQKVILEDLMSQVEEYHEMEFWQAFCLCVSPDQLTDKSSGASEYEIYFNYALARTDQIKIRPLLWDNIPYVENCFHYKERGYHYVSCHDWLREMFKPY